MTYTIFGVSNPSGAFFEDLLGHSSFEVWGRRKPFNENAKFIFCDLAAPVSESIPSLQGVIISFAPIWIFAPYILRLSIERPSVLKNCIGVIAISSSSYLTKRFAFSNYDRALAISLNSAHKMLIDACVSLDLPCQIFAPTLVYGSRRNYEDRNISLVIKLMRNIPCLVLPRSTGLRQPIHALQLASAVKKVADDMLSLQWTQPYSDVLPLGGDITLSYFDMLLCIQKALPTGDNGKKCFIFRVPDWLFRVVAAPLLPLNTKLFEAVMRISSNLSGFTEVSKITAEHPQSFPIVPILP